MRLRYSSCRVRYPFGEIYLLSGLLVVNLASVRPGEFVRASACVVIRFAGREEMSVSMVVGQVEREVGARVVA